MSSAKDLTKGSVTKTLLSFSVPFLVANLVQNLYGIVDMLIVGRFSDAVGLAAVSAGSLIMGTFSFTIIGLTIGSTVLVGQFIGARMEKDAKEVIATSFTLFPLVAIVLSVVLFLISRPLLVVMNTPAESFEASLAYLRICIGGLFFTAGYNTLSGVLRGMGDSKSPLLFVIYACVFNIIGDLILVAGFRMGAAGAAIATVAGQALSMILGIIHLKRINFIFDFKPSSFRIARDKVRSLLRIGVPLALQETLVMCSFIFLEAIINGMGYIAVAAAGIADRVFMLATIPASAFGSSLSAMVAQNMGAGDSERVRKSRNTGLAISFAIGMLLFVIMWAVPGVIMGIFTSESSVITSAVDYMRSYKFEYPFCSLVFCLNGFINGTGHTKFTLWNNLFSTFVVRVPLVYLLSRVAGATLFTIGVGLPVASAVQLLAAVIYTRSGKWRKSLVEDI